MLRFSLLLLHLWLALNLAARAQMPVGTGLRGAYYRGTGFEKKLLTRSDATIDFNWHQKAPAPGVPAERFSVRWTGYVLVPASGVYVLHARYDDGMKVWLGGRPMIADWKTGPARSATARVALEAGQVYDIRVDYFQNTRSSRAFLGWERPGADPPPTAGKYPALETRFLFKMLPLPVEPKILPVAAAPTVAPPTLPAAPALAGPKPSLATLGSQARGTTIALDNLYFEQGNARLLPASGPALDQLVAALRANPAVKLEIAGHTDNVGDSTLNQRLSEQRSQRIRALLIARGIDSTRLTAAGYGDRRPVADNADPAQRPRNRRVEVIVR